MKMGMATVVLSSCEGYGAGQGIAEHVGDVVTPKFWVKIQNLIS